MGMATSFVLAVALVIIMAHSRFCLLKNGHKNNSLWVLGIKHNKGWASWPGL